MTSTEEVTYRDEDTIAFHLINTEVALSHEKGIKMVVSPEVYEQLRDFTGGSLILFPVRVEIGQEDEDTLVDAWEEVLQEIYDAFDQYKPGQLVSLFRVAIRIHNQIEKRR